MRAMVTSDSLHYAQKMCIKNYAQYVQKILCKNFANSVCTPREECQSDEREVEEFKLVKFVSSILTLSKMLQIVINQRPPFFNPDSGTMKLLLYRL